MSSWTNNNRAHTQTWYTLVVLNQLEASFPEAEEKTVQDLVFWSSAASADLRAQQANAIAIQMDNMFTKVWKAKYEEGVERSEATAALESALSKAETTMPQLGAIADGRYRFLGEVDP